MNDERRPDPDALLAGIARAESTRGRLKVFLGMCPGVGKTYAMLLAAQQRQEEGMRVMIGYVETHGRIETIALTTGLPHIPRRTITHRGVQIEEFDLDALLAARPQLAVIDELAHTNAPGSRHPKRWQDVEEILAAGIDVYTTLNVQHVESYRDVVAQITGAPAREAVPDSLLDQAAELELIDISPAELRKRLTEGKVYLGERAITASDNFFREGNLKALREIALRISAERADRDVRDYLRTQSISGPWKSAERYLVAVGPSPFSGHLIRGRVGFAASRTGPGWRPSSTAVARSPMRNVRAWSAISRWRVRSARKSSPMAARTSPKRCCASPASTMSPRSWWANRSIIRSSISCMAVRSWTSSYAAAATSTSMSSVRKKRGRMAV